MAGRRFLALIALLGCVLAGCSDAESDDHPTPTPIESPTSDVRERTREVPTLPPAARKDTLAGAEAFIRHYIELLNHAANTGDVRRLRASSRNCDGCVIYEELYASTYAKGGFIHTTGWKPVDVQAFDQRAETVVLVTVKAPRTQFQRSGDGKKFIGRGGTHKLKFELVSRRDTWEVTYFGVQNDLPGSR